MAFLKFSVGDRVKIAKNSEFYEDGDRMNPKDTEGTVNQTFDDEWSTSVLWDNGKINTYTDNDLELVATKTSALTGIVADNGTLRTIMKTEVEKAANDLLAANNTVTTLEIKVKLRKEQPLLRWLQQDVSDLMIELEQEGKYTFVDTGIYRIYSGLTVVTPAAGSAVASNPINPAISPVTVSMKGDTLRGEFIKRSDPTLIGLSTQRKGTPKTTVVVSDKKSNRISRKKAKELIENNKGHFFTVVFTKKDGSERTMNCQYLKGQTGTDLGYVKVKEAAKMKTSPTACTRNINLQTLKKLKIAGQEYKIS